ncbi:MAG: hypothetical protein JSV86_16805 [Gemmatimonadota bacterium]|nr:MAG: hypothetical protein JSV86_16805 [Gemmatimonadota bacterium]
MVGASGRVETARIDYLIADYRRDFATMAPKELAAAEALLWKSASPERRRADIPDHLRVERATWLNVVLGESVWTYKMRGTLWSAQMRGEPVEPLWRRLRDKRMTASTAYKIYKKAQRRAAREKCPLNAAIAVEIEAYEKLPIYRLDPDGIPLRADKAAKAEVGEAAKAAKAAKAAAKKVAASKKLRERVVDLVEKLARRELTEFDDVTTERLVAQLTADIKASLRDHSGRVRRARIRDAQHTAADEAVDVAIRSISRRRYTEACRQLNITPTAPSKPVDLTAAKKAKRAWAREYHPDVSPDTRDAYEAVIEAYQVIEQYAEEQRHSDN